MSHFLFRAGILSLVVVGVLVVIVLTIRQSQTVGVNALFLFRTGILSLVVVGVLVAIVLTIRHAQTVGVNALFLFRAGILSLVVVGVLVAIVLPIVGLVVMCCRCGGACGGYQQPYDKKHDTCRRGCYTTVMILLLVVAL